MSRYTKLLPRAEYFGVSDPFPDLHRVVGEFIFCYYYLQVRYLFLYLNSVGLHCVQDFYVYERGLRAGC